MFTVPLLIRTSSVVLIGATPVSHMVSSLQLPVPPNQMTAAPALLTIRPTIKTTKTKQNLLIHSLLSFVPIHKVPWFFGQLAQNRRTLTIKLTTKELTQVFSFTLSLIDMYRDLY